MPTGKVKFYDADKGFGFVSGDDGVDVFVPSAALPTGTTTLRPGTRIDYSVAQGRKGAQAMHVQVLDAAPSIADAQHAKHRMPADQMAGVVEDLIKLLDKTSNDFRRGRYPDKREAAKVASVLRAVAGHLDGT
ncbi:MAG: cold shock domain-containing protein [Mobilicoccus sp.]|nr:cold shock domain-containing protein [Mobilicoccus sp.]